MGALLEDAQLYATAELAFQKTRAKLVGKNVGIAAGAIVVAILLLNIALIALAVGFVIALAPLVTIWGAIALVVGALLAGVALLGAIAMKRGQMIGDMFATEKASGTSSQNSSDEDGLAFFPTISTRTKRCATLHATCLSPILSTCGPRSPAKR